MATMTMNYGTYTAMTVTNLQSLAEDHADPFAGWQSDLVDNQTALKADDFEIFVKLTTADTAPANDKAAYVFICPGIYTGAAWLLASQGTTTLPTGVEGTTSVTVPNSLKLLGVMPYSTQHMTMQGLWMLSNVFPGSMPDGFSIIIYNNTGAALATACVVAYRPIKYDIA
jgi:hypothetical protein